MAASVRSSRSLLELESELDLELELELPDSVDKTEEICVVTLIGKSKFDPRTTSGLRIKGLRSTRMFGCPLEYYYSPKLGVVYLHLKGALDASGIAKVCSDLAGGVVGDVGVGVGDGDVDVDVGVGVGVGGDVGGEVDGDGNGEKSSYLRVFADVKYKYAKALVLIFSVSHIVLVAHPDTCFDVSYIHLFRMVESVRLKMKSHFTELLEGCSLSMDWVQSCRPCTPRVLFIFRMCLFDAGPDSLSTTTDSTRKFKTQKLSPVKKLEHALEDQIYRILRKSRIITNVSANSLFAIPANQEFVLVVANKQDNADFVQLLLGQQKELATYRYQPFGGDKKDGRPSELKPKSYSQWRNLPKHEVAPIANGSDGQRNISSFVRQHVELALDKGFDDNVGRHCKPSHFELPTCSKWMEVINKLYVFMVGEADTRLQGLLNNMKVMIDIEGQFLEGRCGKVLPVALAAYQENLPTHYTYDYHQSKLSQALQVLMMHARGSVFDRSAKQLGEQCERFWKNGHQQCELRSYSGNNCVNPIHRLLDSVSSLEDEDGVERLPALLHVSQFKLLAACNCGSKQASKDDAFDAKTANYDFYQKMEEECCRDLEHVEFPYFQSRVQVSGVGETTMKKEISIGLDWESLSYGSQYLADEAAYKDTSLLGDEDVATDVPIPAIEPERQPLNEKPAMLSSATEHLPGMLHSDSPSDLLPKYPSWSLLCLGPSSLYSHNIGIQDEPGFIAGTNFLLPWDVTVKLEKWPAITDISSKKPHFVKGKKVTRDFSELTVKIFLGVEYECPRGHRFMCSSPDKILKATGTGLIKDNATRIATNDMPLYFPCLCRSGTTIMAQLMRIHIVTPKAPVHVTLNPRVQPAPAPCPMFYPGNVGPINLSQSAYWVLRLPCVYVGDNVSYSPPSDILNPMFGRLLKDAYGISEVGIEK